MQRAVYAPSKQSAIRLHHPVIGTAHNRNAPSQETHIYELAVANLPGLVDPSHYTYPTRHAAHEAAPTAMAAKIRKATLKREIHNTRRRLHRTTALDPARLPHTQPIKTHHTVVPSTGHPTSTARDHTTRTAQQGHNGCEHHKPSNTSADHRAYTMGRQRPRPTCHRGNPMTQTTHPLD